MRKIFKKNPETNLKIKYIRITHVSRNMTDFHFNWQNSGQDEIPSDSKRAEKER